MGPEALAHVVRPLAGIFGAGVPDLLVGLDAADDAAVYRLNAEQAIVATTDFFPPVVDDAYTFGAIAATNALSDIYAMGGEPLFCLNLVAFPDDLDPTILTEILRGGAEKVREAGAIIAGGHTVTDDEPKYGLVAIGTVHPDRIFTKGGARPGDILVLTKALGAGLITTALKRQSVREADLEVAVASMTTLNRAAAHALRALGADVHACTDITGYGLLGHAYEMASQSHAHFSFKLAALPILPGARDYADAGYVPGGTDRNREFVRPHLTLGSSISTSDTLLLCDPQTSGGLLAAVAPGRADDLAAALAAANVPCHIVGTVTEGEGLSVD